MTDPRTVIHLVLELHSPRQDSREKSTRIERLLIALHVIPARREKTMATVWLILPARTDRENAFERIDLTGPVPESAARHTLDSLETTFEKLGFRVVIEANYV